MAASAGAPLLGVCPAGAITARASLAGNLVVPYYGSIRCQAIGAFKLGDFPGLLGPPVDVHDPAQEAYASSGSDRGETLDFLGLLTLTRSCHVGILSG